MKRQEASAAALATLTTAATIAAIALLAACGGGAGNDAGAAAAGAVSGGSSAGSMPANPAPVAPLPAPAPLAFPDLSQPVLALPAAIADGSTVELQCGRVYRGTLDLRGKSNVTVRTAGTCGMATITTGGPVTGWTAEQGGIYRATPGFDAAQVLVDGAPVALAHWPNAAQGWARATASTATTLSYAMPSDDLAGATLVFRPWDWAVEARRVTSYAGGTMALAGTGNPAFDGYALSGQASFYVEGKSWMLDEAGEWAMDAGALRLWAPDGRSPEGRTWAVPARDAIDAGNSKNVVIDGVRLFGAANGINAMGATGLRFSNGEIADVSENGILGSGGSGLSVLSSTIRNVRHDAIAVKWGGGGEAIRGVRIEGAGTIGMPTAMHAAINLTASVGATVADSVVTGAGHVGIRVHRNAVVSGNTVDGACLVLTDCGGIYLGAPDGQALAARVTGNTIANVGRGQRLAWGIQLDNGAAGVTVDGNTITGSGNGVMILDGHDNTLSGNTFAANTQAHIQMAESGGTAKVRNNVVTGNRFTTTGKEEMYRLSSDLGAASVALFGSYDRNDYASNASLFANFAGAQIGWDLWKAKTAQDASSTFRAP